jgi:hypothetical protein
MTGQSVSESYLSKLNANKPMLTTIATILVILWLLGYFGFHVLGSFIHILLVIAVIMFLIRIIQGRNPVS